ncbi:LOB domain-containing protein 16-like [Rutidosis leptorrhynchoides]|uniref:LOB domain-containing protein 16-like n=1 Tax=Rutidosis leptorrhynchoides TaxID=125765 RepID=UPI003A99E43C
MDHFGSYFQFKGTGLARFAAIHKVLGTSNVSKMLHQVAVADCCEALVIIAHEAQARIKDRAYGCVAYIFALQHQFVVLDRVFSVTLVTYVQRQLQSNMALLKATVIDLIKRMSSFGFIWWIKGFEVCFLQIWI